MAREGALRDLSDLGHLHFGSPSMSVFTRHYHNSPLTLIAPHGFTINSVLRMLSARHLLNGAAVGRVSGWRVDLFSGP